MFPGVLVVGGAALAYPGKFVVDLKSWQHLVVLVAITVTVGNICFAVNRYGVYQVVDYILYLCKIRGPVRGATPWNFLTDLGRYVRKSLLQTSDRFSRSLLQSSDRFARARDHVAFRLSAALLLLTFGEVECLAALFHSCKSQLNGHGTPLWIGGLIALVVAFWQMIITRRIDYFLVNDEQGKGSG
jgi:hypothetical protein